MPRRPTTSSALDNAKKDAKRWLKALRENDEAARARFRRALPNAAIPNHPTLRDVQHAYARDLGFSGWAALKKALLSVEVEVDGRTVLVRRFLDNACPDHHVRGRTDHIRAQSTAMRLLSHFPDLATTNLQTAIVCGDIDMVTRLLAERPELAKLKDAEPTAFRSNVGGSGDLYRNKELGPKGWEPLLSLCFTRLPLQSVTDNAVAIATLLLDHGADPNAFFQAGGSRYTPLVGAIGEGEEERPAHQRRNELVDLLLQRGAEPYDIQVVYNIHFQGDVLWYLQRMYDRSVQLGRKADWDNPEWPMLDMGGYGSGALWHLGIALENNDLHLAEWCLAHGASPNAAPASDPRFPQRSLYEEAIRRGETALAELLLRFGAKRVEVVLKPIEAFFAASMRLDEREMKAILAAHPEVLKSAEPLMNAASNDRDDIARLLLDLGVSPNVENETKERPLHRAGYANAVKVGRLLIERGADIDPVEQNWSNTPLAAARWSQAREMIDLLSERSRDVWELTYEGKLDRLREIFAEKPELARVVGEGETPLMWLPADDESNAIAIAKLFLSHGADPTLRNGDGMTAADRAERLGMFDLARLLGEAAGAVFVRAKS